MTERFKLQWGTKINPDLIGNGYGYRVHNQKLMEATERLVKFSDDAEDIVIITSPEFYKEKVPGKRNWLFTMFEGTTLPEIYIRQMEKADYFLAPSNWVKGLMSKYFNPEKIFVVNHGVDPLYTFKTRQFPLVQPFRFLWVGAPNPRKGWEEIIHLWSKFFAQNNNFELYVKTTMMGPLANILTRKGNVILDARNISEKELLDLYHSSHCFLFPTRGEGFGLTLAEAMATGLPCISTYYSGVLDFFNYNIGYPVGYNMGAGKVTFIGEVKEEEREHATEMAFPEVKDLLQWMLYIPFHYKEAVEKGELASKQIRTHFTWGHSARRLVEVIQSQKR